MIELTEVEKKILDQVKECKEHGYGNVEIKVCDGKVVFIRLSKDSQIK